MEVPGGTDTDVVVDVAIPVVDVEAVLVEVADAGDVAGVNLSIICPFSSKSLGIEVYRSCEPMRFFPCILFGSR